MDSTTNTANTPKKNISNAELDALLATGQIQFDATQVEEWTKVGASKPTPAKPKTTGKKFVEPAYIHERAEEINAALGEHQIASEEPITKSQLRKLGFCTNIDNLKWTCATNVNSTIGRTMCDEHYQAWISGMSEERAAEVRAAEERRLQRIEEEKRGLETKSEKTTPGESVRPKSKIQSKKKKFGVRGEGSRVKAPLPTQKTPVVKADDLSFKAIVAGADEKTTSGQQEKASIINTKSKSGSPFKGIAQKTQVQQPTVEISDFDAKLAEMANLLRQKDAEIKYWETKYLTANEQLAHSNDEVAHSTNDVERLVQDLEHANALISTLQGHNQLLANIISSQHVPQRALFGHPHQQHGPPPPTAFSGSMPHSQGPLYFGYSQAPHFAQGSPNLQQPAINQERESHFSSAQTPAAQ